MKEKKNAINYFTSNNTFPITLIAALFQILSLPIIRSMGGREKRMRRETDMGVIILCIVS